MMMMMTTAVQNNIPIAIADDNSAAVAVGGNQDIDQGACQNAAGADRGSTATGLQNTANLVGDDIDCS